MKTHKIQVVRRTSASIPVHSSPGATSFDLCADLIKPVRIAPGQREVIPTGLSIGLPEGLFALVLPRYSLAVQHGVTLLNSPGIIDHESTQEIEVLLINQGAKDFEVLHGTRVAQLVFGHGEPVMFVPVAALPCSQRSSGATSASPSICARHLHHDRIAQDLVADFDPLHR